MSKKTADLICRGLLMIVAAIREEFSLPAYSNIVIRLEEITVNPAEYYKEPTVTNLPPQKK